jgi:hypothetical protein
MSNCCEGCKSCQPLVDVVKVQQAWEERKKLHAESAKLHAEGKKCHAEGYKLHIKEGKLLAEGHRLYSESDKLLAESSKLSTEGDLIFINTVIEVYGNVEIKWNKGSIIVEGIEYK